MVSMLLFFCGLMGMSLLIKLKLQMIYMLNFVFIQFFFFLLFFMNLNYYNVWSFVYMDYGVDKISGLMSMLTLWISALMILSIMNMNYFYYKFFNLQLLFMLMSLLLFFFSLNLLSFFIFFEISLIPILFMILGWGNQFERLQAGMYMLIYTMISSLPFFLLLIFLYLNFNSLMMMYLMFSSVIFLNNFLIYMILNLVFLIKLPVYFLHLWLPKAHVEAPVFGSMILAGILLKLGGYGIIRFVTIFLKIYLNYSFMLILFAFLGALNISVLCLRQIDLKMLIAYSSVVHMGFMLVGILSFYYLSLKSAVIMMIGHGICSSGLFCLLNFNYTRINSRSLIFNKGMGQYFINMNFWWFLFSVMNMAAPPSLNLVAEILLIILILKMSLIFMLLIFLLSFFSGVYSIYFYSFSQHGMNYFFYLKFNFNSIDEFLLMISHWSPMNMFILNLSLLI